jgi:ABC-type polar amino acid transport system ATPase subunit
MKEAEVNGVVLSIKNLNKSYNGKQVLDNISINIKKGEIVGVIGPSGSGKTTLLRCIDLLENFESGEIIYDNTWKVSANDSECVVVNIVKSENAGGGTSVQDIIKIRQNIGFVFQDFNLWEEKSVLKNLTLGPIVVQSKSKSEAIEQAMELASQFGLKEKIYNKGWELSGGQKQRVAIIRALLMQPNIMLLDEITSALDPVLTMEVLLAIRKLREKGLTMMLVTHHIEFATTLCDRLMFLSKGKIIQLDTPRNLRENPLSEEISKFLYILKSTS